MVAKFRLLLRQIISRRSLRSEPRSFLVRNRDPLFKGDRPAAPCSFPQTIVFQSHRIEQSDPTVTGTAVVVRSTLLNAAKDTCHPDDVRLTFCVTAKSSVGYPKSGSREEETAGAKRFESEP